MKRKLSEDRGNDEKSEIFFCAMFVVAVICLYMPLEHEKMERFNDASPKWTQRIKQTSNQLRRIMKTSPCPDVDETKLNYEDILRCRRYLK
jgi:hypothetical protein